MCLLTTVYCQPIIFTHCKFKLENSCNSQDGLSNGLMSDNERGPCTHQKTHTAAHKKEHKCGQQAHSHWHWESIGSDQYGCLFWLHTEQLLLKRCQWRRWNFGKLSKSFGVWQQRLSTVYRWGLPEPSTVLLVTRSSPAEAWLVPCSFVIILPHAFLSPYEVFAASAHGCIHQSSQGTTANWFPNRIS